MTLAGGRAALLALVVALLPGCALLSPAQVDSKKYVLNTIPADLPRQPGQGATLLVLPPDTMPIYATTLMAYTPQAHEIAYFSQNEWAATPTQMLLPLIVETLRRTQYFRAVWPSPYVGPHSFVLRSELLELQQDFSTEPATLKLAIRVSLSRAASDQLIATQELRVQEPMPERAPYGGVVAANRAMERLLRQLAQFVPDNAR